MCSLSTKYWATLHHLWQHHCFHCSLCRRIQGIQTLPCVAGVGVCLYWLLLLSFFSALCRPSYKVSEHKCIWVIYCLKLDELNKEKKYFFTFWKRRQVSIRHSYFSVGYRHRIDLTLLKFKVTFLV